MAYVLDGRGRIVYSNPAAEKQLNAEVDVMLADPLPKLPYGLSSQDII